MSPANKNPSFVDNSSLSNLESLLDSLYNLADLSENDHSEANLEVDFARRYIKDLVVSCPN